MATQPRTCADCGTTLGLRNTSGYCGRHVGTANMRRPGVREKASHRMRMRLAADPELRASCCDRLAKARALRDPEVLRARWIAQKPWVRGNAAQPAGGEARRRAAASISATRLAAIPPHMRDRYRALTAKGVKAAEAQTLILEEHEIEMRRWRRSVGAEPVVETDATPSKGVLYIDRASAAAAQWAGVSDVWVRTRDEPVVRARWAVYLALRRGGWTPHRIAKETGMERKGVGYGLAKAEILAAIPGEFADLLRRVVAA